MAQKPVQVFVYSVLQICSVHGIIAKIIPVLCKRDNEVTVYMQAQIIMVTV